MSDYLAYVFLNIMFHAMMGRFQFESKLELPFIYRFYVVPFSFCVLSCRPLVTSVTSLAGLGDTLTTKTC